MSEHVIHRSQRFTRAARAERDRLARRRSQVSGKREELQSRLDDLDKQLEAIDVEIDALDALTPSSEQGGEISLVEPSAEGPRQLRGAAIRSIAIPCLLSEQGTAPIHYREWLALLTREGFSVAGKRPDAVFLNQVSRSPLVRATTKAGYYVIDLDIVEDLRAQLRREQSELAELMSRAPGEVGEAFDRHRTSQHELTTAIARTQRELDEAVAAIKAWESAESVEAPQVRAA
jgi:predicted nuclease with TOPRIM domain